MGQNALGQSDFMIFKSNLSLEQSDEKVWFFACWYRFMEIKSWLENIGEGIVKNACDHCGLRTQQQVVFQKGINWFLVCW